MPPSTRDYLQHILDETSYIMTSVAGIDKAVFMNDETLKRAYVRSIEVIGEVVKQLPIALRQKYNSRAPLTKDFLNKGWEKRTDTNLITIHSKN